MERHEVTTFVGADVSRFQWHLSFVKKEQPDRFPVGLRRRHAG